MNNPIARILVLTAMWTGAVGASEEFVLTGLTQVGTRKQAFFTYLPSTRPFSLEPGEAFNGVALLEANIQGGWVRLQKGTNSYIVTFPTASDNESSSADINTPGAMPAGSGSLSVSRSRTASGITGSPGNMNAPPGEGRRSSIAPGSQDQSMASAMDSSDPGAPPEEPLAAAERLSRVDQHGEPLPDADAQRLKHLLLTPPPAVGSLQGDATTIGDLKRLKQSASSPAIRARIQEQLNAYSSPPI